MSAAPAGAVHALVERPFALLLDFHVLVRHFEPGLGRQESVVCCGPDA